MVAGVHSLAALAFLNPVYTRPDSVGIYSYLRSMVIDGDLLFLNEWAGFGLIANGAPFFKEVTQFGTLANHWWIGTSLLSSPFYLVAHFLSALLGNVPDGFWKLYALTLSWTTVGFALVTSLICENVMGQLTSLSRTSRWTLIAALWLGTPLFWYEFRFPLGSHLAGALCVAVLCKALVDDSRRSSDHAAVAIGLALGLATATRIQHIVLAAAVVIYAIRLRRPVRFYLLVAAGVAPGLMLQGAAWWVIYGSPLGPLVSGANASGSTWMPFHTIAVWPVLVSSYHGLLPWSPIAGLCIGGLLSAVLTKNDADRNRKAIILTLAVMFALEWFANGTGDRYFWGGMSFGARRFVDLALPLSVGLALFWQRFPRMLTVIAIALSTIWSISLTTTALSGRLELARDVTPIELLSAGINPVMSGLREAISRPEANAFSPLLSFVAFLIVGSILTLLALAVRSPAWATRMTCAVTIGAAALVMFAFAPTRSRASLDLERLEIDREVAARSGPLNDQRTLLEDEAAYYEHRGKRARAQATRAEIEGIDRRLQELHQRPTAGQ